MSPIRSTAVAAVAIVAAASAAPATAKTITLPAGFSAEAMTAHDGALYVSSQTSGEVRRVDTRSGKQTVLVPGRSGERGNGLRFAPGHRLIVAGGTARTIDVFDSRSGRLIRRHTVPGAGFLNGVAVQGKTAYVTDTLTHLIHALPTSGKGSGPHDQTGRRLHAEQTRPRRDHPGARRHAADRPVRQRQALRLLDENERHAPGEAERDDCRPTTASRCAAARCSSPRTAARSRS